MNQEPKKILVVDDDPSIVEVTKLVLEMEGYDVETALACPDLEQINYSELDLILLDIWLGNANGGEICQSLKRRPETQELPVVLISANPDTKNIAKVSGADDYLNKPFDINDLLNKVKEYTTHST